MSRVEVMGRLASMAMRYDEWGEVHDAVAELIAERDWLQARLDTNRCNRGHETLPLTLWDCPECHNETKRKLAELAEALKEGRRAIGDHHAPGDCYATGPLTGDDYRDLVECPACSFIAKHDAALARIGGDS